MENEDNTKKRHAYEIYEDELDPAVNKELALMVDIYDMRLFPGCESAKAIRKLALPPPIENIQDINGPGSWDNNSILLFKPDITGYRKEVPDEAKRNEHDHLKQGSKGWSQERGASILGSSNAAAAVGLDAHCSRLHYIMEKRRVLRKENRPKTLFFCGHMFEPGNRRCQFFFNLFFMNTGPISIREIGMRVYAKDPLEHTSPDGIMEGAGSLEPCEILKDAYGPLGYIPVNQVLLELKSFINSAPEHYKPNPVYVVQCARQYVIMEKSGGCVQLCGMRLSYDRQSLVEDHENGIYKVNITRGEPVHARVFLVKTTDEFDEWFESEKKKTVDAIFNGDYTPKDNPLDLLEYVDRDGKIQRFPHHPMPMVFPLAMYSIGEFKKNLELSFPFKDSNRVYIKDLETGEYLEEGADPLADWVFAGMRLPKDLSTVDTSLETHPKGTPPEIETLEEASLAIPPPYGIEICEVGHYTDPLDYSAKLPPWVIRTHISDDSLYRKPFKYQLDDETFRRPDGGNKPTWIIYNNYQKALGLFPGDIHLSKSLCTVKDCVENSRAIMVIFDEQRHDSFESPNSGEILASWFVMVMDGELEKLIKISQDPDCLRGREWWVRERKQVHPMLEFLITLRRDNVFCFALRKNREKDYDTTRREVMRGNPRIFKIPFTSELDPGIVAVEESLLPSVAHLNKASFNDLLTKMENVFGVKK